jgi:hypothetical protein
MFRAGISHARQRIAAEAALVAKRNVYRGVIGRHGEWRLPVQGVESDADSPADLPV